MAHQLDYVCTLCYNNYDIKHPLRQPKKLTCEHTFCTECIIKLKELQGQAIECPLCQKPTLIPSSGVETLLMNLDAVGLGKPEKVPDVCSHCIRKVYPPKPVTLFCRDCETSYCGNCSDIEHLKPENGRHSIILESAKSRCKSERSFSQFSDGEWSRSASMINSEQQNYSSKLQLHSRPSSSQILDTDMIPDCPTHGEKMRIYCRTDRCLCCSYCQNIGDHRGHDCFQVHEAEEKERIALQKLQQKVDLHSERYIKARGDVQRMIEDVKKNSITVKDVVRRYLRELRAAIDATEKNLLAKLGKRGETNLKALREQLSKMIEISSIAKTASRNCDNALSFDYYEMLLRRRAVEEEMYSVLEMMVATEPVARADLYCQFPKHESLLNDIKTCSFIVEAPPAPSNFTCSITREKEVRISWDDAEDMQYIYPPLFYTLQANTGSENAFIDVCTTKQKNVTLNPKTDPLLPSGHIQFRVCAENIVSRGQFCHPFGIKIPS